MTQWRQRIGDTRVEEFLQATITAGLPAARMAIRRQEQALPPAAKPTP
jgi:hypothetical protein